MAYNIISYINIIFIRCFIFFLSTPCNLGTIGVAIVFVIIFCTAYTFLILVYFPLLYKNSYYSIIDNYITIEKGIILKRFIKISISKIQYVEIVTYPLQRLFKLNTLVLHTAGSQQIISPLDTIESIKIKQIIEGTYEKT